MSLIVFFSATVLCSAGFYIYIKQSSQDPVRPPGATLQQAEKITGVDRTGQVETGPAGVTGRFARGTEESTTEPYAQSPETDKRPVRVASLAPGAGLNAADTSGTPGSPEEGGDVQELVAEINTFYDLLDSRTYMKRYYLDKPSREYFSSLIQKLVDNPPVVTRETDDLFTLLKNTAHFFRILGKQNILMLKGILDREKDSFEKVLRSFYSLTSYPRTLLQEYSLSLPQDSLYDYAGFFLTTMGGRLYLFRRDSTSRMTVSFYAILVVDRFKDAGSDRHGLDLVQPIDSLIDEIENAGNRLRLKEDYLDILYDLKEKYAR